MSTEDSDNKPSSELSEAAEALVRAAVSETEKTSLALEREKVQKFETIVQTVTGLKEANEAKLESLHEKMTTLGNCMLENTKAIQKQSREQALQFAIEHIDDAESFTFHTTKQGKGLLMTKALTSTTHQEGSDLIRAIMFEFRRDSGYDLPIDGSLERRGTPSEEESTEFRNKVVSTLHFLIGVEPRLEKGDNDQYTVYYS